MKRLITFCSAMLLMANLSMAQDSASGVKEDFKPSTLNQPGKEYPMVNSQGYARFRIEAPDAKAVTVSLGLGGRGGTVLQKAADGSWMGTTEGPMDELVPFIDAHFNTLADKEHRAMAGLSMGGMETKQITLDRPEVFSRYALLSGGVYAPEDIKDKSQVKLIFISCGSRENPDGVQKAVSDLKAAGFNAVSYVSENTAHEFLTWRRSLYQLAPLLFNE